MYKHKNTAKETALGYGLLFALLGGLAVMTSGCFSGELYSKIGYRTYDEHQESQRTYKPAMPLKCYMPFVDCSGLREDSAPQGS